MSPPKTRGKFDIAEPKQIRALASPIRQDILDTVTAIGPCSVADVARVLDRIPDGLYYHVKLLIKTKLLVTVAADGAPGSDELRFDVPAKAMQLRYDPWDARNRAAVSRVVATILRSARRTFVRAYVPGVAVVAGPHRNLWAGRTRGALSAGNLEEVNRLLARLGAIMQSGRSAGRRTATNEAREFFELTFVLAPTLSRGRSGDSA